MPPTLGYWKTRGLAQPIRLLLHHVREDFNDVKYEQGDAPDYSREQWDSVKYSLGLPFPNIPYYIDGDIKITQSNAILRYIGRKHNLLGKTEMEKVAVDVLLDQSNDFRNGIIRLAYSSNYEELKKVYFKELPPKLEAFEKVLKDNPFFVGKEVTVVDFVLYELFDQLRLMQADYLENFHKIQRFLDNVEALPNVNWFMGSDKFISRPVNNKIAKFK